MAIAANIAWEIIFSMRQTSFQIPSAIWLILDVGIVFLLSRKFKINAKSFAAVFVMSFAAIFFFASDDKSAVISALLVNAWISVLFLSCQQKSITIGANKMLGSALCGFSFTHHLDVAMLLVATAILLLDIGYIACERLDKIHNQQASLT